MAANRTKPAFTPAQQEYIRDLADSEPRRWWSMPSWRRVARRIPWWRARQDARFAAALGDALRLAWNGKLGRARWMLQAIPMNYSFEDPAREVEWRALLEGLYVLNACRAR